MTASPILQMTHRSEGAEVTKVTERRILHKGTENTESKRRRIGMMRECVDRIEINKRRGRRVKNLT
jgi:hypothetical protein